MKYNSKNYDDLGKTKFSHSMEWLLIEEREQNNVENTFKILKNKMNYFKFSNNQNLENIKKLIFGKISPIEYFQLFVTDEILEKIVFETNLYFQQTYTYLNLNNKIKKRSRIKRWKTIDLKELKTFIGIVFWTGIHSNNDLRKNWNINNDLHSTKFNNYMSSDRFSIIMRYLHLCNNDNFYKSDPFNKIRVFVEEVRKNWTLFYTQGDKLNLDETMIKFKGKCSFKQHIPDKPVPWGIKAYLLCDSQYFYCIDIYLYTGKKNYESIPGFTTTENLVINLMKPYLNQNKVLFCDSYYTSINLQNYLLENNTGLIGTCKNNRILEREFLDIPKKGKFITYINKGKNSLLTIYNDRKMVYMLNSVKPVEIIFKRNYKNQFIPIPNIIDDYNKYAHAVDKNNQMTYNYRYPHKSVKWWLPVFFHLLQISMLNSYVIFKENVRVKTIYSEYYESVIKSLLGEGKRKKFKEEVKVKDSQHYMKHDIQYIFSPNFDIKKHKQMRCVNCKNKKTIWRCSRCLDGKAYLCIPDCYNFFHNNLLN